MSKELKIGSFNLLNLQLPERPYYNRRYTYEEFEKKQAWISHQLNSMKADIIGFQEVFSEEALKTVIRSNPYYRDYHIVMSDRKGGSPAVAIASRYPIKDYEVIREFPEQLEVDGLLIPFKEFSRPLLKCQIEYADGQDFHVVVAHLKSKRPMLEDGEDRDDPLAQAKGQARALLLRAAESAAVRTVLMEVLENRDSPVVVIGDLNDTHTSVTTRIISGEAPFRYLPMHKKRKIWDVLLYHAKDIQARNSYTDTYYTHLHNGHHEALDHIMVSQELVRENPNHIGRVTMVRTFNDHLLDETISEERIPNWQSDHAQVVVHIEMR